MCSFIVKMSSVLIYNVENNKSKENTSQKNERCVQTFDWYCRQTKVCERATALLTVWIHILAQLGLGLAVGSVTGLVREARGHGCSRHHRLEAALALLDIQLGVENNDIDFRHVEHPQCY